VIEKRKQQANLAQTIRIPRERSSPIRCVSDQERHTSFFTAPCFVRVNPLESAKTRRSVARAANRVTLILLVSLCEIRIRE
jgi:hypothetical protein